MSHEQPSFTAEHHEVTLPQNEVQERLPDAAHAEALRPGEADPLLRAEQARSEVEQHADASNPLQRLEAAENASQGPAPSHVNRELKAITLRRELQQIRRQLPATQRRLSQLVHQPVIRVVSEAASKSVSRPSGLLGGGLVAFLGCSGYLYLAKHIGFTYNYFVFILLFVLGFGIGLLLELVVWLVIGRRRPADN